MADGRLARKETSPPIYKTLSDIYPASTEAAEKRFEKIKNKFVERYGHPPQFCARASGRVNIIGEHIDYCGYGVLPMAVEQDIVIAVRTNDTNKIILANTNSEFGDHETTSAEFVIDKSAPKWFHYFLCGFKGITEHLKIENPKGMEVVLDGTVPKSAGLSSSSALVCCASLATLHANGLEMSKHELAEVCTKCERYIGTQGGGMDQSISFLAEAGTAKYIQFDPIRATDVQIPAGVGFVIANSLVEMNKSATASTHFNVRVVECRLAAKVLAKAKGLDWKTLRKLGEVQETLGATLEQMAGFVEEVLKPEPYTKEELCTIFSLNEQELIEQCMSASVAAENNFKLHDRAKHVYTEADRVLKFKEICDSKPNDAVKKLGNLMNVSHESCRDMYQCSCEELDQLVEICKESGSLGSRLTGAGWGGCTVSMVPSDVIPEFLNKVTKAYYAREPELLERVSEALFATEAGNGAALFEY